MLEDTISIRKNKNSTNIKKEQKLRQYGTHKTITGLRTDALEWYCIINKVWYTEILQSHKKHETLKLHDGCH